VRLEPAELTRITYRVRRGDTLSGIARRYQTTVADLKTWNRLRGTRITAGDRLVIYVPADAASELQ
jgi:membrane-bound lytic murein transglycosylase D